MKNLNQNKQNLTKQQHISISNKSSSHMNLKQPSSLLKHQILQIIKDQLKNFKVRSQLLNELSEHQKKQKNKQLSKEIFQSKMQVHHQNERIRKNKKLQQFQKKQNERQQKLKTFRSIKQKQHVQKFESINRMLEITKSRYSQITNQESNLRLSKLMVYASCYKKLTGMENIRQNKTSYSQSRNYDFSKPDENQRQNCLVTTYINKIKRSESKILEKQLQKEQRKQAGKKEKVKCFVIERAKQQLEKMQKAEKQYKTRMQTYQSNNFKINESRLMQQENHSVANLQHSRLVFQRRYLLKKQKFDSSVTQINTLSKNPLQFFRNKIDITNDSRLMQHNLKKMKDEQIALKEQATFKLIADKLQKIKDLKYGQRLDGRSAKILLQLLDRNDPQYATIAQFLQTQRKTYMQALAKKEQQRSKIQKNKKTNKSMGKTVS